MRVSNPPASCPWPLVHLVNSIIRDRDIGPNCDTEPVHRSLIGGDYSVIEKVVRHNSIVTIRKPYAVARLPTPV